MKKFKLFIFFTVFLIESTHANDCSVHTQTMSQIKFYDIEQKYACKIWNSSLKIGDNVKVLAKSGLEDYHIYSGTVKSLGDSNNIPKIDYQEESPRGTEIVSCYDNLPENKIDDIYKFPEIVDEEKKLNDFIDFCRKTGSLMVISKTRREKISTQKMANESRPSPSQKFPICGDSNDFLDNKDGTLTDKNTGLIWKRCYEGTEWDGTSCKHDEKSQTAFAWVDAMQQAKASVFLGKNDWRLPTIEEIVGGSEKLTDCHLGYKSNVECREALPMGSATRMSLVGIGVWSSSIIQSKDNLSYFMQCQNGMLNTMDSNVLTNRFAVRLVRGGKTKTTEFNENYQQKAVPRLRAYEEEKRAKNEKQKILDDRNKMLSAEACELFKVGNLFTLAQDNTNILKVMDVDASNQSVTFEATSDKRLIKVDCLMARRSVRGYRVPKQN